MRRTGICIVLPSTTLIRNFAVALAMGLSLAACTPPDVSTENRPISIIDAPDMAAEPASKNELISAVGPAFLTLTVSQKTGSGVFGSSTQALTSGSGFLVDNAGFAMTAAHVAVAKGNLVRAEAANGRKYSGVVVDVAPERDMAVIKLKDFRGVSVTPAASACTAHGASVFSLGKPHAMGDTARFGQLESMHFGRPVQYGPYGYPDAMVLRMGTQKGESGGPLFNAQGQLIGMIVSTLSDTAGRPLNLAHAVPAANLAGFLCQHMNCTGNWAALTTQSTGTCGAS
jgi:S1-C subfamily serine protease